MNNNNGQKLAGRLRWSLAVREELARRLPSAWQPTGQAWRLPMPRKLIAAASVVRRIERSGGRQLRFRRMPPMRTPSRPRRKGVATFGRLDVLVEQCGYGHSETVRGDDPGGDGSRD